MLRYRDSDDRPKVTRSKVPITDINHFRAGPFPIIRNYLFHPFSVNRPYKGWCNSFYAPDCLKWHADMLNFYHINQENFTNPDQQIYHHVRRRSYRLPENDILINYNLSYKDFTVDNLWNLRQAMNKICYLNSGFSVKLKVFDRKGFDYHRDLRKTQRLERFTGFRKLADQILSTTAAVPKYGTLWGNQLLASKISTSVDIELNRLKFDKRKGQFYKKYFSTKNYRFLPYSI